MPVNRDTVVEIAHAEMNDEYGVDLIVLGARAALTAAEAIQIAGELVAAAYDALSAAQQDIARPIQLAAVDVDTAADIARRISEFGGEA